MTHSITIELPEAIYQSLSKEAQQKGKKAEDVAAELLALMQSDKALDNDEFELLADELADYVEKYLPPDAKPLSGYAMSREGIYEDELDKFVGAFRSDVPDWADNHDKYLGENLMREMRGENE